MTKNITPRHPYNIPLCKFIYLLLQEAKNSSSHTPSLYAPKTLEKCLSSLQLAPFPICNFSDTFELIGFGEALSLKCELHLKSKDLFKRPGYNRLFFGNSSNLIETQTPATSPSDQPIYIPKKDTAAYAILMSLGDLTTSILTDFKKSDIITKYSLYTSVPLQSAPQNFRNRTSKSFYNGWNSMKTLKKKDLVSKPTPKTFKLTLKGQHLYKTLKRHFSQNSPTQIINSNNLDNKTASKKLEKIKIKTFNENYKLVLLVDDREIKTANDEHFLIQNLSKKGLSVVKTRLLIGDFIYVLINLKKEKNLENYKFLNIVIEKKRCSDLAQSIKDGRYHKQKLTLKRLNILYRILLIEGNLENEMYALPLSSLKQAICSSEFVDGFLTICKESLKETSEFLLELGNSIFEFIETMSEKEIEKRFVTFKEFINEIEENEKIPREVELAKKLCCVEGVTSEKAMAIAEKYKSFKEIYEKLNEIKGLEERRNMFVNEDKCDKSRSISKIISQRLYLFFMGEY